MAAVTTLSQARALLQARKSLQASIQPGAVIWKRRMRHECPAGFKRLVLVELLANLDLRVTDELTGDLIVQGPALGSPSR